MPILMCSATIVPVVDKNVKAIVSGGVIKFKPRNTIY
jgi:hypothetical protein